MLSSSCEGEVSWSGRSEGPSGAKFWEEFTAEAKEMIERGSECDSDEGVKSNARSWDEDEFTGYQTGGER